MKDKIIAKQDEIIKYLLRIIGGYEASSIRLIRDLDELSSLKEAEAEPVTAKTEQEPFKKFSLLEESETITSSDTIIQQETNEQNWKDREPIRGYNDYKKRVKQEKPQEQIISSICPECMAYNEKTEQEITKCWNCGENYRENHPEMNREQDQPSEAIAKEEITEQSAEEIKNKIYGKIRDDLKSARMEGWGTYEGDKYPLVDFLSRRTTTIDEGIREINNIVEQIDIDGLLEEFASQKHLPTDCYPKEFVEWLINPDNVFYEDEVYYICDASQERGVTLNKAFIYWKDKIK